MRRIVLSLLFWISGPALAGDVAFQYSTISALMAGAYDGRLAVADLLRRGDLGLGTYNGLDGEMVILDGKAFQAGADGDVAAMPGETLSPFAVVTAFEGRTGLDFPAGLDLASLEKNIEARVAHPGRIVAIRVDGRFPSIKVRSVPRQSPPYRPLAEVITRDQAIFDLKDAEGTLVGFRFPPTAAGVNVPGYHFHFLTADRRRGGHVLALTTSAGRAGLDEVARLEVLFPEDVVSASGTAYDPKQGAAGR